MGSRAEKKVSCNFASCELLSLSLKESTLKHVKMLDGLWVLFYDN